MFLLRMSSYNNSIKKTPTTWLVFWSRKYQERNPRSCLDLLCLQRKVVDKNWKTSWPTCSDLDGLRIQTLWYLLSAREATELSFSVTDPYLQHNTRVSKVVSTVGTQSAQHNPLHQLGKNYSKTTINQWYSVVKLSDSYTTDLYIIIIRVTPRELAGTIMKILSTETHPMFKW